MESTNDRPTPFEANTNDAPDSPTAQLHEVFSRMHRISENIHLLPGATPDNFEWFPMFEGSERSRSWAYHQSCTNGCHGSFDTLNAVAHFCPYCGTPIDNPVGIMEARTMHVQIDWEKETEDALRQTARERGMTLRPDCRERQEASLRTQEA